jgi:hypothetical protein
MNISKLLLSCALAAGLIAPVFAARKKVVRKNIDKIKQGPKSQKEKNKRLEEQFAIFKDAIKKELAKTLQEQARDQRQTNRNTVNQKVDLILNKELKKQQNNNNIINDINQLKENVQQNKAQIDQQQQQINDDGKKNTIGFENLCLAIGTGLGNQQQQILKEKNNTQQQLEQQQQQINQHNNQFQQVNSEISKIKDILNEILVMNDTITQLKNVIQQMQHNAIKTNTTLEQLQQTILKNETILNSKINIQSEINNAQDTKIKTIKKVLIVGGVVLGLVALGTGFTYYVLCGQATIIAGLQATVTNLSATVATHGNFLQSINGTIGDLGTSISQAWKNIWSINSELPNLSTSISNLVQQQQQMNSIFIPQNQAATIIQQSATNTLNQLGQKSILAKIYDYVRPWFKK